MIRKPQILTTLLEILLLFGLVASAPWVQNAIGCGGDSYYSASPAISVQYESTVPDTRNIVNNKIAVFTGATVKFKKGHTLSPGNYFADLDTHYLYSVPYDYTDAVEYRRTMNETTSGWSTDTSSSSSLTLSSVYAYYAVTGSLNSSIEVRDLAPHETPGTTDDESNGTASAPTLTWVIPTTETSTWLSQNSNNGATTSYHNDYYSATFSNSGVSFEDLYIYEIVNITSNQCGIEFDSIVTGSGSMNSNNQVSDTLGGSGPTSDDNSGCAIQFSQQIYLRNESNSPGSQIYLRTNTLNFKFYPGGGWEDYISQRCSSNTAQNPSW